MSVEYPIMLHTSTASRQLSASLTSHPISQLSRITKILALNKACENSTGRLARDDFIFRKRWPLFNEETRPIIIIYLSPAPKNQVAEERQHYLGRSEPLDWRSWARLGKSRVDSKQVVSSL
ncbi:hypothetical protein FOBRF1_002351 [Fusarium oxysporum]